MIDLIPLLINDLGELFLDISKLLLGLFRDFCLKVVHLLPQLILHILILVDYTILEELSITTLPSLFSIGCLDSG